MSFEISTSLVWGALLDPGYGKLDEHYESMDWDNWRHSERPYIINAFGNNSSGPYPLLVLLYEPSWTNFSDRWNCENWVVAIEDLEDYKRLDKEFNAIAEKLDVSMYESPCWMVCAFGG